MQIKSLSIENFKRFHSATFNFHPKFNLIVGSNATGKSSLLRALCQALAFPLQQIGISGLGSINEEDINRSYQRSHNEWRVDKKFPVSLKVEGVWGEKDFAWTQKLSPPNLSKVIVGDIKSNLPNGLTDPDIILPCLLFLAATRRWKHKGFSPGETFNRPYSFYMAYKKWVDPPDSTQEFISWVLQEEFRAYRNRTHSTALKVLVRALQKVISGIKDLSYDPQLQTVVFSFEEIDSGISFNELSDGQRMLIGLISEIVRRSWLLNHHLQEKVLELTPGVVMIDELDLHLHPSWQRRIVETLRVTFPNIQFFAATHSPQIVGETKPDELIILNAKGEQTLVGESYGRDTNWVLRYLMDTQERIEGLSKALQDIDALIFEQKFEDAKKRIAAEREIYGSDPALAERDAAIDSFFLVVDGDGNDSHQ